MKIVCYLPTSINMINNSNCFNVLLIKGPLVFPNMIFGIQLFQLSLSPGKAEKSNTSAKSLLGVTIKNTQTEQNFVLKFRDT